MKIFVIFRIKLIEGLCVKCSSVVEHGMLA
jgi:hypothetical protein